jgi:hypothetical protein
MNGHRRTACAVATLACVAVLAWGVVPSYAWSHGGGGASHGGGGASHGGGGAGHGHGGGASQGRAGWHGGSWHGHEHWHTGFGGSGISIDVPWWPYGYAYPYEYPIYSPPVVAESSPPEYVEPAPQSPQYWYYCWSPQGYYPYVTECPGGWLPVAAQPGPPSQ